MTIGIYQIINQINNKSYVGQSRNIEKRWSDHKVSNLDYPLYRAFKKYGIENFSFLILEACEIDELNEKEIYWIKKINPEYNQTEGGNFSIVPQKLNQEKVHQIQQLLLEGNKLHTEIAEEFGVHKDTIRDINVGRTWYDNNLNYPLHRSKYNPNYKSVEKSICPICHGVKTHKSKICANCYHRSLQQAKFFKDNQKSIKKLIKKIRKEKLQEQKNTVTKTIVQIDKKTNKILQTFDSIADAARFLFENNECSGTSLSGVRSHISAVCKGKRKTAYGYKWQYV